MVSADTFTASLPPEFIFTKEFLKWKESLDLGVQTKVDLDLKRISERGILPSTKSLKLGLYERKYKSGARFYFGVIKADAGFKTLLIGGSFKGTKQIKTFKRARLLLEEFEVYRGSIKFGESPWRS